MNGRMQVPGRVARSAALPLLAAAAAVTSGLASAPPASGALRMTRCVYEDATSSEVGSLCGRIVVPLDRTGRVPGTVALNVSETRASGTGVPVVVLGSAGAGPAESYANLFGERRRIVAFTDRGDANAPSLKCPRPLGNRSPAAAAAACAATLGPRRAFYGVEPSAEDLEAVRAALGLPRVVVLATAGMSGAGLAYAARYPQHVDSLILEGAARLEGPDLLRRARFAALPRVLRGQCRGRCVGVTRDPVADLAAVVRQMRGGALHGWIFDGQGRRRRASLSSTFLATLVNEANGVELFQDSLIAAVHSARIGDRAPLLRLGMLLHRVYAASPVEASLLAPACNDGVAPWTAGTAPGARRAAVAQALAALPERAFAPFDWATAGRMADALSCVGWPETPSPRPPLAPPSARTLIVSGELDLYAPRSEARALARQLPQATLVEIRGAASAPLSDDDSCARAAVIAFVAHHSVRPCKDRPRPHVPRSLPLRLRDVPRFPRAPRPIARQLTAVFMTINDAVEMTLFDSPIGGLRGGSSRRDESGFRLRRYSAISGMRLSGSMGFRRGGVQFDFALGGAAEARGRLRLTAARHIRGTLGGRRVDVVLPQRIPGVEGMFTELIFTRFDAGASVAGGAPTDRHAIPSSRS